MKIRLYIGAILIAFVLAVFFVLFNIPKNDNDNIFVGTDDILINNETNIPKNDIEIENNNNDDIAEEDDMVIIENDEPVENNSEITDGNITDETEDIPVISVPVEIADEDMPADLAKIAQNHRVVGMSVAIIENGQITALYNYGYSNRENQTPMNSKVFVRVAAISRPVSALSLMQLVENEELDLDADVSDYLGFKVQNPAYKDEFITTRQIMTNTSSISDYNIYNDIVSENIAYQPLKEIIGVDGKYNNKTYLLTKIGTIVTSPSNFGMGILGCIQAKITNQTIDEYMKKHIFNKLEIDATYFPHLIENKEMIADIYRDNSLNYSSKEIIENSIEFEKIIPEDNYRISQGNLFINTRDLAKIARLYLGYGTVDGVKIISENSVKDMINTSARNSIFEDINYGMCVSVEKNIVAGRTLYGHQGNGYGAVSECFWDYSDKSGVVIITNGASGVVDSNNFSLVGKQMIQAIYKNYIGKSSE